MTATRLVDPYDVIFFDLDGVIYLGPNAVDGSPEGVESLRSLGKRVIFVTNNAARHEQVVADQLTTIGFPATTDDLITSAQVGAAFIARELEPGSKVLVAGTKNLVDHIAAVGLIPVDSADDHPDAVIQGYDPKMTWPRLDEACIAIQQGARWFATNDDSTRPTERGIVPGAGAAINAVGLTVNLRPTTFGKPFRPLLDEAKRRTGATKPIFVGDRIDTDIIGANNSEMDSVLVFTGAHGKADLVKAGPGERPTFIAANVLALTEPARLAEVDQKSARCREQSAHIEQGGIQVVTQPNGLAEQLDALWAVTQLAWAEPSADSASALAGLDLVR